jgi:hypothetical protein
VARLKAQAVVWARWQARFLLTCQICGAVAAHVIMTTIWVLIGVVVLLSVVYGMWLFDCLVRWEHEHYREQWERDGKPDGYFWRAEDCAARSWSSDSAKKRLGFVWLFRTPSWIAERTECRRWLVQMRVLSGATSLGVLGVLSRLVFGVLLR